MTAPLPHIDDHTQGTNVLPSRDTEAGVSRFVVVLAVTGTILLALGAFWLSFTTLRDLAVLSGIPADQAWIWPLIVDGVILEATISVVALRNSAKAARQFAWLLLAAGAGVSVAANITHAIVAADTRVPALIAALVASVPPLVLLAMTHLTVELTRNSTPANFTEQRSQPARPIEPVREKLVIGEVQHSLAIRDSDTGSQRDVGVEAPGVVSRAVLKRSSGARADARSRAVKMSAEGVPKRQIAAALGALRGSW